MMLAQNTFLWYAVEKVIQFINQKSYKEIITSRLDLVPDDCGNENFSNKISHHIQSWYIWLEHNFQSKIWEPLKFGTVFIAH